MVMFRVPDTQPSRVQVETPSQAIRRGSVAPPMFGLPPQIGPGVPPQQRLTRAESDFANSVARRRARMMFPRLFGAIGGSR